MDTHRQMIPDNIMITCPSKIHTTDLEENGGLVGHSLVYAIKVNVVIKVKDRTLIEKENIH